MNHLTFINVDVLNTTFFSKIYLLHNMLLCYVNKCYCSGDIYTMSLYWTQTSVTYVYSSPSLGNIQYEQVQ